MKDSRFNLMNPSINKVDEMENGDESPPSTTFNDVKISSTFATKRNRRSLQKRVVSVPIKDIEGSRRETAPPSDSWAWRKYGQKPIKGSPYPRGYYRCSSSKGCPARKQVERSRLDPTMLVITYSCEHNHPWPASRNSRPKPKPELVTADPEPEEEEEKPVDLVEEALVSIVTPPTEEKDDFSWFGEFERTFSTVIRSPIFTERRSSTEVDTEVAMFFPMREEDESLFADLGELPEGGVVFKHGNVGPQVEIC